MSAATIRNFNRNIRPAIDARERRRKAQALCDAMNAMMSHDIVINDKRRRKSEKQFRDAVFNATGHRIRRARGQDDFEAA